MTKLQQVKQKKNYFFLKNDKKKNNKNEKMRKMKKKNGKSTGKKWREPQLQGARMNETLKDPRNYHTK